MFRRLALVLVLMLCFGGVSDAGVLRLGILPVLDTLPLHVAVERGLFEKQGLSVELVPFASAMERDTAMKSNQLDGYFGDLIATLTLIRSGVPMRIATVTYATTPSQRMFAIVTSPKGAATGAPLGFSRTTIMEFLLDRLAPDNVVAGQEFERLEVKKIPIRMQMLMTGQLGYAILPEPLATLVEAKGGQVLATDEALDIPLTVISLREDKMGYYKAFMAAYGEALAALGAEPESFRQLMAANCRIPGPLVKTFPMYRYPEPRLPTHAEVDEVQQWMLRVGLLKETLAYELLIPEN